MRTFNVCLLVLLPAGVTAVVSAQQSSADETPLRRDADAFFKIKFTRLAEEAFAAAAAPVDPAWDEPRKLLHWVQAGDWDKVAAFIKQFEEERARRIHAKICSDLSFARPKPMMLPEDVIALADASPYELEGKQITHVGGLLRSTMVGSESRTALMNILQRGTARLGGDDEERRRITAQILANAQLYEEAKAFGFSDGDLPEAVENTSPITGGREWDELVEAIRTSNYDDASRDKALDEVHEHLLNGTPQVVDNRLKTLLSDQQHLEVARQVLAMIGRKTAASGREIDLTDRALHIELQSRAMDQVAASVGFAKEPWRTMANLTAGNWLTEARYSHEKYPLWQRITGGRRNSHAHVPVEHLIQNAPSGKWLKAVAPQPSAFVQITLSRLILFTEDIDRVLPQLRDLQQNDKSAAAELANAYLARWAQQHDPNLSEELLKQYKLDKQSVVLTRAQQEASLAQLGKLLSSLDAGTRKLLDEAHLARAFDLCHSQAEVHTREHVIKVFGPIEDLSADLAVLLVEQMRNKLALQWRELSVQRDGATRRTAADIFDLVNHGYAEATKIAADWLNSHPGAWQMHSIAGSLYSDWGEFAYFQTVAADDDANRFADYLKHSGEAVKHFRAAAAGYAETVSKRNRTEYELRPYRAWFYGLLGITHDGGVNLRKGITREGLQELRQAILDLPGGADDVHLQLFSEMVADNIEENRIAPEMKYRYLSSAVEVTGSRPTVYPAEEKIKYYDSLLQEIRLETRIDGGERIASPGQFGLFVSLVHTVDVARESGGFDMYLMNQVQRTVSGRTIVEKPLYRDRFEESLRLALGSFFDIRSIVFADPADGARDIKPPPGSPAETSQREWQQTPLCYVLLGVRDATVDRIPSLEIELDFFDREGKVVIPVPSNPLQIEIAADVQIPRPSSNVTVTQIVDSRTLADNLLKIDVNAQADGLVPELDQLLRLSGYSLPVQEVVDQGGLQVRELHNGADGLYAQSERSWTIHLDPTPLLQGAREQVDFAFPTAISPETEMVYRRYEDMDPVDAAAQITLVEGDQAAGMALTNYPLWYTVGAGSLLFLAGLAVLLVRGRQPDSAEGPPRFSLPTELTPFSVISLLHRIQSSPSVPLTDEQRASLRSDVRELEEQTFARETTPAHKESLEKLARRWLNTALTA